jgi:hypothetical protein
VLHPPRDAQIDVQESVYPAAKYQQKPPTHFPPDEQSEFVEHPEAVVQVGVPEVASVPSVQLKVFAPVVGAVLSVELPVDP